MTLENCWILPQILHSHLFWVKKLFGLRKLTYFLLETYWKMQFARFSVNLKQNYYSIWYLTLTFNPGYVLGNPKKTETRVDRRTGLNKNPKLTLSILKLIVFLRSILSKKTWFFQGLGTKNNVYSITST